MLSDQPPPTPGAQPVEPYLIALIRERTALGITRYGTALHTHNGRDPTIDALQEALDLCQYLAQALLEARDRIIALEDRILETPCPQPTPCKSTPQQPGDVSVSTS